MKKIKHYEIIELLGSGGMGEVYKAFDPRLEREVAIKVMHRHLCDDDKIGKRFLHEARAAAGLVHPNIVAIYETGKGKRGWFIVMEYIKGQQLTHHLSKKSATNPNLALNLIRQILGALFFAHTKGTLHRDIKADNIMVTGNDVAKILDFGIAKIMTKKGLTVAGDILGTVEYMAPEQMLGEAIDHRCDIYAVGILLYQILTKRLPFEDENPVAILYKKLNEDPVPPSYHNHSVGLELDQVVLKAITKNQNDRWASAEAFSEALNSIVQSAADSVKPRNNQASKLSEFFINVDSTARSPETHKFQATFVGRKKELQRMTGFIDRIIGGQGQTVILKGEAGVGKSTLANRLANSLELNKAWILYGVCLYQQGLNAYLPFMDAVRGFFSKAKVSIPAEKLADLTNAVLEKAPLLHELTEVTTTDSGTKIVTTAAKENSDSENLFEAWCQLIRLFTAIQPAVLIIDDLHLADEASLRLFHYLAHHISDERLLLLGITRADRFDLHKDGKPTIVSEMLSRISREPNCEKITLYRLGRESCDALIDKTLSPALFTEDFYNHVYKGTKGNPLFVLETLKLLLDRKVVFLEDGIWHNSQESIDITIPRQVEDVFVQKLSALNNDERELLQVAAVIGYKFAASRLSRISHLPKIDILKVLQRIEAELQIIAGSETGFHFEHPMLRDILYDEVTFVLRQEYHSMIAADLEAIYKGDYGDKIGEMAKHLLCAGKKETAAPLLYQAAQHSFGLGLYRESSTYINDYLSIIEQSDTHASESIIHLDLYFKLGKCYEQTGRWDESLEAYKLLSDLAEKKREFTAQIEALESLGRLHIKLGNYDSALEIYNQCVEFSKNHGVASVVGRVYNNLGVLHFKKGDLDKAGHYFNKSIQQKEKEKENIEYGKAYTLMNLGIIANMQGNYKEALERYDEAIGIYIAEQDRDNQARVYVNIGMTYLDQGEYSKAIDIFDQGLQLITKIEDQELRGLIYLNMAKAYALDNKYSEAEKLAKKALKMFKLMGDTRSVAEAYQIFGLIHGTQGNLSEAELFFNESLRLNEQEENLEVFAETCQAYANVYKKAGRKQKANEFYNKALATYKNLNLESKVAKVQAILDQSYSFPKNNNRKINVVDDALKKKECRQKSETTSGLTSR